MDWELINLLWLIFQTNFFSPAWRCSRGVMVKAMDFGIVISEFELKSRYYIHIQTYTIAKGMNPLILPAMG